MIRWHARLWLLLTAAPCLAQGASQASATSLRMILPSDLYAVVGHETNVYFDNIVLTRNLHQFVVEVTCPKGRHDEERWRFTPAATDVGEFALTVRILDEGMRPLATGTATVDVCPADAGAGREVSLLCVGDSLTHASVYPEELLNLCRRDGGPRLRLVGTHHPIPSQPPEVVHEGYGGWAWETFCTHWTEGTDARARSPFLWLVGGKPTLDFQHYCDLNNQGQGPDFITVFLGCNDNFGANEQTIEASIGRMFSYADRLLAEFRRVRRDTQIGILCLTPPAASQDAFGSNYACGQTRWQYRRNQHRVVERMMEKWGGSQAEGIALVPSHVNLDTVRGYPVAPEPASDGSAQVVARQCNGVHPSVEGYRQIANTIYAWLKCRAANG